MYDRLADTFRFLYASNHSDKLFFGEFHHFFFPFFPVWLVIFHALTYRSVAVFATIAVDTFLAKSIINRMIAATTVAFNPSVEDTSRSLPITVISQFYIMGL